MYKDDTTAEEQANAAWRRSQAKKHLAKKTTRPRKRLLTHLSSDQKIRCKGLLLDFILERVSADDLQALAIRERKPPLSSEELLYVSHDLMDRLIVLLRGSQPDISLASGIPGYSQRFAAPHIQHAPRKHFAGTQESD